MTRTKKVFIRTFGCQMNEYDSDKMADVLAASEGFEKTSDPADADLILFNTCSVREKAQEKVFADLGRVRDYKRDNPDVLIGVGGCVASQEGGEIVRRAPFVDLVFGPQTLHRLPELIAVPPAKRRWTFPSPRSRSSTTCRRRVSRERRHSSSIMEGCSKYCSFCVVPYTRGEEFSRPMVDVLREIRDLAGKGVKEVTLLGQNVNAYRGELDDGTPADFALLLMQVAKVQRIERIRYTTSHPLEFTTAPDRRIHQDPEACVAGAPARAVGLRPRIGRNEAQLHGDGVPLHHPAAASRTSGHIHLERLHRRIPRRD